jgi:pyruvate dehydrogenase E2 component (dihydrolipoamide acetyltransferase)
MATEFLMPKLGLTMEEGTIAEWLVDDGEAVQPGAAVLRIETDKTETDVEASASGRLHAVGAVGDTYACGELIGWFLAEGEDVPAGLAVVAATAAATIPSPAVATAAAPSPPLATRTSDGRLLASPNARRLAAERGLDLTLVRGTGPSGRIVSEDLDGVAPTPPLPQPAPTGTGAPATVAARQLADLLGIDLAQVPADPVDRRVTRESVAIHVRGLLAAGHDAARRAADPAPSQLPASQSPTEVIPFKGMRGTIAARMHGSLQQMAQLTLFMDADLDLIVADREARKAGGSAPSYTDYIIAATARALIRHPRINSQVTDAGIALLPDVHVGMAVTLDEGLIVPVVRATAGRDLASLGAETSRLAEAARKGSLDFADLEGGTFSVSTLGMFGVDGFTPVINPPNSAILGVGRLRDDVVIGDDGSVAAITRITLSLTWDHRVFDGAPAAEFCRTICELLQRPADLDGAVS